VKSSPFTAVFDACVLYPAPLRDFLMWLALSGRFRARWTDLIHDEWVRNLLKNPSVDADRYLEVLLKQGLIRTVRNLTGFRTVL
jgi:3',5'-cyclic AMP phosphodiesterase CpdA